MSLSNDVVNDGGVLSPELPPPPPEELLADTALEPKEVKWLVQIIKSAPTSIEHSSATKPPTLFAVHVFVISVVVPSCANHGIFPACPDRVICAGVLRDRVAPDCPISTH